MSKPYTAKIVMSGPTGAGKTSLLAAMYPLLETHFPSEDYQLVPEENTRKVLDNLRAKLQSLGTGGIKIKDKQIAGTLQAQEFNFDLRYNGVQNAPPSTDMSLQVWDIPGAYCTADNGAKAREYLDDSDISFWCVDSVSLMERHGEFNESTNAPNEMADCFLASKMKPGHTMCIVLMRSETYQQYGGEDKLLKTFKDKYAATVMRLRKRPCIGKIFICAIQTTGNLRFNVYEGSDPVFIRAQSFDGYAPKFCELPVLVAVSHSLDFAIRDAAKNINRITKECFPFTRWLPFLPGHVEYKHKKEVAKRLPARLKEVRDDIKKVLEDETSQKQHFQEW